MTLDEFETIVDDHSVVILDCRRSEEFAKGFVPNSLNIGLESNFAMWVGELIPDINHKIALVCPEGQEMKAMIRLSRVGFDHSIVFLGGGFENWKQSKRIYETSERISAAEFEHKIKTENIEIIDVRKKSEYDSEHVEKAIII
jgi:hydroxyacylglutathione hydrolase